MCYLLAVVRCPSGAIARKVQGACGCFVLVFLPRAVPCRCTTEAKPEALSLQPSTLQSAWRAPRFPRGNGCLIFSRMRPLAYK
jgi:hypothetical protein